MRQLFLSIAILFLSIVVVTAQNFEDHIDVVILKDGSLFKGVLLEYDMNSHVLLQTSMVEPLRIEIAHVEKVIQDYQNEIAIPKEYEYGRNYYQVELGTPITSNGDYGLEASVSGVRQYSPMLGIGAGISYVEYSRHGYSFDEESRIPVFLIYRAYFMEGSNVPYFQLNAGYAFNPHETNYKAGLHANPKLGLRFGQEGLMLHLYIGAHLTKSDSDYVENPWDSGTGWEQKRTIRRTTFGMGITF